MKRRLRSISAAALATAAFTWMAACGVRTEPRAPEQTAARAPDKVTATVEAKGVTIEWSRPTKTVDGSRLYDLAKFVVERQVGDSHFEPIGSIDVTDLDRIRPQQSFHYVDATPPAGDVCYRVRAVTRDGEEGIPTEPVTPVTASPSRHVESDMDKRAPESEPSRPSSPGPSSGAPGSTSTAISPEASRAGAMPKQSQTQPPSTEPRP